jgi:sugar phosphate isomerase/epimerase
LLGSILKKSCNIQLFCINVYIGHSHGVNGIDEEFINRHIDRLYHRHVHDGKGKENHLPLGVGEINIMERLSLAKEHN